MENVSIHKYKQSKVWISPNPRHCHSAMAWRLPVQCFVNTQLNLTATENIYLQKNGHIMKQSQ